VELTLIAGFQIFPSKFAKAFRIAPQGFAAERSGAARARLGRSIVTDMVISAAPSFSPQPPRLGHGLRR
jgi:hypothetical protein